MIGQKADKKVYLEWPEKMRSKTGELLDPWGTPYRIIFSGTDIAIRSAGPNKRFDDMDDITNGTR